MPNWCENDLAISGPTDKVKGFIEFVETDESKFDFNVITPYPSQFAIADKVAAEWHKGPGPRKIADRPEDGFNNGGYYWRIEHWGTKWPPDDITIDPLEEFDSETTATYHFNTAWSPPEPVIIAASKMFPELMFDLRYFECGCAFNGLLRVRNGEIETQQTGPYFGNRGG